MEAMRWESRGVTLGAEIEGEAGRVGMPRIRRIAIAHLCIRVAQLGYATSHLIYVLVGLVTSAFLYRRPLLGLLEQFYCGCRFWSHTVFPVTTAVRGRVIHLGPIHSHD